MEEERQEVENHQNEEIAYLLKRIEDLKGIGSKTKTHLIDYEQKHEELYQNTLRLEEKNEILAKENLNLVCVADNLSKINERLKEENTDMLIKM